MTNAQTQKMIAAASKLSWKTFVATYAALATSRKATEGYTVVAVSNLWEIRFNGVALFAPMTADVAYTWFERTAPLRALQQDADSLRTYILS